MRRSFLSRRHSFRTRLAALLVFSLILLLPLVAFAQDGDGAAGWVVPAATFLLALFGAVTGLINFMAAKPVLDGWDKAKRITDKISPFAAMAEEWANPESDAVPPSPANPNGRAGSE